jgi:hypothetical protein
MQDTTEEHSRIEYVNEPDPEFRIEPVGDHSPVVWEVDWEEMERPIPDVFRKIGTAEVKLVVAGSSLPDELQEEFNAAHEALVDLREAMLEYRGIEPDSDQGIEVAMGNLDGLPEVSRRDE